MGSSLLLATLLAMQSGALFDSNVDVRRSYPGTLTGDALLRDYMGPQGPRDDPFLKGGDIVNQQMARGYMNGIKDATEGTVWCYVTGKPHELNDDIAAALTKLDARDLRGRAAPLVADALRRRFPCPAKQRSP